MLQYKNFKQYRTLTEKKSVLTENNLKGSCDGTTVTSVHTKVDYISPLVVNNSTTSKKSECKNTLFHAKCAIIENLYYYCKFKKELLLIYHEYR